MTTTLYYVHDPMCSWCWGFRPALSTLIARLPSEMQIARLLGGLAPDSHAPMAAEMQEGLQQTWRRIQARIPGTAFNFDFWTVCSPRRSTYPACRAVIAARLQDADLGEAMTSAIQHAYYLEARNPSDRETLIALASAIGADPDRFARAIDTPETQAMLEAEMASARRMGADSFPALVLDPGDGSRWRIPVEYSDASAMLETIESVLGGPSP